MISVIWVYYIVIYNLSSMKTLVIGANGFLGRHLVKKCLDMGWIVDCIYHKNKNFIPKVCKSFPVDNLAKLKDSYDAIFLLSAFIPENESEVMLDKRLLDVNIKIPLRVINHFKRSRIIFSSSTSVYGTQSSVIFENSSFNDPDNYALSKLAAEFILKFSANYQIMRFSSIYGSGMTHKTFIPKLLEQAKKSNKLTLFGNGSRLQNYIYVEDAVGYLMATVNQKKPGIYLGVSHKSYSNTNVAKVIQKFIPGCKIQYLGEDKSSSFVYNNLSTKKRLKYNPKYSLEEGIDKILKDD